MATLRIPLSNGHTEVPTKKETENINFNLGVRVYNASPDRINLQVRTFDKLRMYGDGNPKFAYSNIALRREDAQELRWMLSAALEDMIDKG